mmetsp:Transcript_27789/g.46112  ORF Transcript_27789/g.46112 Transcript_27789/m.46112 type:complete len:353 (+) Transcript_27789:220-1278(+)
MTLFTKRTNISHWTSALAVVALVYGVPVVRAFLSPNNNSIKQLETPHRFWTREPVTTSTSTALFVFPKDTAIPTRKQGKHTKRGKKAANKKKTRQSSSNQVLSEPQLRQHVASQYVHGPSGVMRGILAKQEALAAQHDTNDFEHIQHIHKLNRHPALLLNADYQPISYLPLSMWHWQEAVKAVFSGKVTVVDVYPDVMIRAANLEIPLPSVIALNDYVPQPNTKPAFTKRNVYLRDQYRCQYCNDRFATRDLSLDHVMPRCMGGSLTWENAVTSCRNCNGRKGSTVPAQLKSIGMRLLKEPYTPTQYQLHSIAGQMLPRKVHHSWGPYLNLVTPRSAMQQQGEAGMYFDSVP